MKIFLATVAATFCFGVSAFADDRPARIPADALPGWTGFYIGANGGYGWRSITNASITPGDPNTAIVNADATNVPAVGKSFDAHGALGGIQLGYNWQVSPNWVAGIEADFNWSDVKGNGSAPTTVAFGATPATFDLSQNVKWFGTVRGRLGFLPSVNLLLYGMGGLAYGKVNETANITLLPGNSNSAGNFSYEYACGGIYGGPTCLPAPRRAHRSDGPRAQALNTSSRIASRSRLNIST
ncbi:hypothetical protein BH10PSE10_BH10PSE10_23880 [soil metagenome]